MGKRATREIQRPAYAATLAVDLGADETYLIPAQLTGAMTINATITEAEAGDQLTVIVNADGTARTVTFGTGLNAAAIVAAINLKAAVNFVHDGTEFVEVGRYTEA